jgi:RNA polymerase sigma-70 factor (ECF subfamily)
LLRKNRPDDAEITFDPVTAEASLGSGARMFPVELSLAVQAALARLNPDQREAVLLKVYQGFKFEEMAEILEIPVSTVKSRLYTALDLLKTALTPLNAR